MLKQQKNICSYLLESPEKVKYFLVKEKHQFEEDKEYAIKLI